MLKFLKYLGTTLLALAVLILILPYFINLNSYKKEITAKAQEAIGRELRIGGDIKFRILPRPYIKLKDITLASAPQAQEPTMVSVKELEVVLSILPLFSGKVDVAKIILAKPSFTLEKLKNGKGNWELDFTLPVGDQSQNTELEKGSEVSRAAQDPPIHVRVIKIQGANIRYIEGDKITELKDINLFLDIESFQGPLNFELGFKAFDEDVALVGRLKEIGSQIPVEAKVKLLGKKLNIGGIIDVDRQNFKGDLELSGTLKQLKQFMPNVNFPDSLTEKYKLKANMTATPDKVSLDAIDFNLRPLQAQGSAVLDLKEGTGALALDLMPGVVHIELRPEAPRNNQFSGAISVKAKEVLQLLQALKIKTNDIPPFLLTAFSFATHVTYKDHSLALKGINLDVGKANLDGSLTFQDWETKGKYTLDLRTKNLSALGKLMDIKVPEAIGPAKITGSASGELDHLTVDLSVYAANAHTHFKGTVIQKGKAIKPDLTLVSTGKNLQSTLRHLGQQNPANALGQFHIKAQLSGDIPQRAKVVFQKSFMTVGRDRLDLKGSVDLFLGGTKPKITADISLSSLNLDRLLVAFEKGASNGQLHLVAKHRGAARAKLKAHWSHDKIDLSFLRDFDGDVKLSVPSLRKGSLVFDSMKMDMRIANGILDITSLKGNLYGGGFGCESASVFSKGTAHNVDSPFEKCAT